MAKRTAAGELKSQLLCEHQKLVYVPSAHANEIGYHQPAPLQRAKARGKNRTELEELRVDTFPGPLVLPGDDLALDPEHPPQSAQSWIREKHRNKVTGARRTIYVAAPPAISSNAAFVGSWTSPTLPKQKISSEVPLPQVGDVVNYIAAFYHGLAVKIIDPQTFQFDTWEDEEDAKTSKRGARNNHAPELIGIVIPGQKIGVRTRPAPDRIYKRQLSLNDILDAAISALPGDAYALVMLVHHDLYEDDEDEFVCGRAYGGSRVAVISSARYHPSLDARQNVESVHAWPNSHCSDYIDSLTSETLPKPRKGKKTEANPAAGRRSHPAGRIHPDREDEGSPLMQASRAVSALHPADECLTSKWLGRICRTVAHELGHCFGIDHCVYYACLMQGSASISEDARQPPYLCPVDLHKLLRATGAAEEARYKALLSYCEAHADIYLFAAFAAWIKARIIQLESKALGTGAAGQTPGETAADPIVFD